MTRIAGIIVAVDKPVGMSSHGVVNLIRRITGVKRVGHGGTLDPMASGVLVIGVGREATKKLIEVLKQTDKEYLATIRLDGFSSTDDAEGKIEPVHVDKVPSLTEIEAVLNRFEGELEQMPPVYSAVKIKGKPAYKYVREGKAVKLRPRKVVVKGIKIQDYEWPRLRLKITVGSGFYVRSLARDIGKGLGAGGYLVELTRIRVGQFELKKALSLGELEEYFEQIEIS